MFQSNKLPSIILLELHSFYNLKETFIHSIGYLYNVQVELYIVQATQAYKISGITGMNFDAVRSESSIDHAFPFNSEKKRGGVAEKLPDSEVHVHWKGAAEIVSAACTRYMDSNEQLVPLDEGKNILEKAIEDIAAGSLRCVAIAYRPCKGETVPTDEDELAHWELPEGDLVLLAIIGLKDPCRPGVRDAVELCVKAGVKVRMVTGDNLHTARAIALECGILASNADAEEPTIFYLYCWQTLQVKELREELATERQRREDLKRSIAERARPDEEREAERARREEERDAKVLYVSSLLLSVAQSSPLPRSPTLPLLVAIDVVDTFFVI